jgi:hypothetical protein
MREYFRKLRKDPVRYAAQLKRQRESYQRHRDKVQARIAARVKAMREAGGPRWEREKARRRRNMRAAMARKKAGAKSGVE